MILKKPKKFYQFYNPYKGTLYGPAHDDNIIFNKLHGDHGYHIMITKSGIHKTYNFKDISQGLFLYRRKKTIAFDYSLNGSF